MVCPTRIRSLDSRLRCFKADEETPYLAAISEIVSPRPMVYRISSALGEPSCGGRIRPHELGNASRDRFAQLELMRSLSQFFGFTGVRNKAGLNEYGRHIRRFEDQKRRLLYLFFVQLCDFAHVAKHGLPHLDALAAIAVHRQVQ